MKKNNPEKNYKNISQKTKKGGKNHKRNKKLKIQNNSKEILKSLIFISISVLAI